MRCIGCRAGRSTCVPAWKLRTATMPGHSRCFAERIYRTKEQNMATGPQQMPPQAALSQMITASWLSQAISVAAELGLADALKDGPLSVSELAKAAGANADALNRVLRALASVGVFRETPNGRFDQTALSACMRSDVPGSMRAWARVNRAGWQWQMLGNLLYSVRTGNASSSGAQLWEHFARNK